MALAATELDAERSDLLAVLAQHRQFLRYTTRDLTDEQARARTTVSELTLGGLIKHVTAVDVGYGQLDWRLRNDARVRVMERTNFRLLADDAFPNRFDLIAIDASFISLRTIWARAVGYLREDGTMVALVKPQFEAGRERVGSGGVVRDRETHRAVLRELREVALSLGLVPVGLVASPLLGPAGNREFLMLLRRGGSPFDDARIEVVLDEGSQS